MHRAMKALGLSIIHEPLRKENIRAQITNDHSPTPLNRLRDFDRLGNPMDRARVSVKNFGSKILD